MKNKKSLLLVCTLLLTACSAAPVPPDLYYTLAVPAPEAKLISSAKIMVEPFQISGVYSERPLIYRTDGALRQYTQSFWAEPPAVMWQNALVDYLHAAGMNQVYTPESRMRPDYIVRSRVRQMELSMEGNARSVLAIEFLVSDATNNLILRLLFDHDQAVEANPSAHAQAVGKLTGEAYGLLAQTLAEKLKK